MSLLADIALGGIVLPAALGAVGFWAATRLPARWTGPATAAVTAATVIAAHFALFGAPRWPATDTLHWMAWLALLGALLVQIGPTNSSISGKLVGPIRRFLADWSDQFGLLGGIVVGVAVPWGLLGPLVERGDAGLATLAGAGLGIVVVAASLDLVLRRLSGIGGLVLLGMLAALSAGVVAVGRTVVVAQLVGAMAAGFGGVGLVALLRRHPVDASIDPSIDPAIDPAIDPTTVRTAALPAVAVLATAALGAHHYAYLTRDGLLLLAAAPVVAAGVGLLVRPSRRWLREGAVVVALVVALGSAAAVGEQPEDAAPAGSVEEELDYGYDEIDLSDEGPDYSNLE